MWAWRFWWCLSCWFLGGHLAGPGNVPSGSTGSPPHLPHPPRVPAGSGSQDGLPRSKSVALEGRLVGCLYRAPPRPQGRRPRGLILTALGGGERAERRYGQERRRGVQKPLAECQGKTVPIAVWLVAPGRSVPGGPPRSPAAGNPGSGRRRAGGPEPWVAPAALQDPGMG